jgi:hypothetical protein
VPFRNSQHHHVAEDLLSAYLDNQVTAAERDRIEGHLHSCAVCQRELDTLRQTVTLLRAMPRVQVPHAFTLSEAQVGIRRPAARPAWYGGALRGFAAVTAMLLVALVAANLLRRQTWTPSEMVALAPKPAVEATAAPAAAPREATQAVVMEKAVVEAPAQPSAAPTAVPEVAVEVAEEAPLAQVQPAEEAQPPAPETQPAPAAKAAASETTPFLEPTLTAEDQAMAALTTPPGQAEPLAVGAAAAPAAAAVGRGGGDMGAAGPTAAEAEGLGAESPAPAATVASVLPATVGVVYTDQGSLWALDRQSGQRQLLEASAINSPQISSDRAWIAYRTQEPDHAELWAVPWDGNDPRMVLDERVLPARELPQGYRDRRIQGMTWMPGQHRLAVVTMATPAEVGLPPEYELWTVDVESGNVAYVVRMGQADRPFYAPGGKRFALLRNEGPDRGLWLVNADGSEARAALDLPPGSSGPVYDWQVRWLPDGSTLWVAVPGPASDVRIALHRVSASGQSELVRTIEALDAYWSPEGSRLAYTRPVSDSLETRELYLANSDGSEPSLYATPRYWSFLGWSPDGMHFLYQDNQQVYLGTPGGPPQALGNFLSIFDPRWISADQFLHFLDQDANWVLGSRWVDGRAASLATLPRDVSYDVTPR